MRVVAILLLSLCAGTLSAQEPLYDAAELHFLSHMIVHHGQALELSALVPSRTDRDELKRFARYIAGEQQAEIDHMKGLLQLAADRGIEVPHHEMHGDPPMAGMLSKAQMAALEKARGAQFERLWLEGMILHHQGALDMGLEEQNRQFETGRRPYGLDVMVEDIVVVQRAEITQMRTWLKEWGLKRSR